MNRSQIAASLLFLGTGASLGVPIIGCSCAVCTSKDSKNKRLRTAALLKIPGKQILIDSGPDFREQALRHEIKNLDGLIITHAHYDHIGALDEMRVFALQGHLSIPSLASNHTIEGICTRFPYFLKQIEKKQMAQFDWSILSHDAGALSFLGLHVRYVSYEQAHMPVNGFIFGDLAYFTDVKDYTEDLIESLQGVEKLVINALKYTPSPFHLSIDEAIEFGSKAGVKEIWLTHMSHELDFEKTASYLPSHVHLAYDGLEIPFFAEASHHD
jgi:phosphoribosyl 1,2-cyclic phosphate phosphodiesterase